MRKSHCFFLYPASGKEFFVLKEDLPSVLWEKQILGLFPSIHFQLQQRSHLSSAKCLYSMVFPAASALLALLLERYFFPQQLLFRVGLLQLFYLSSVKRIYEYTNSQTLPLRAGHMKTHVHMKAHACLKICHCSSKHKPYSSFLFFSLLASYRMSVIGPLLEFIVIQVLNFSFSKGIFLELRVSIISLRFSSHQVTRC